MNNRLSIWSLRLLLLAMLAGAVFTGAKFYNEQKPDRDSKAYYDGLLEYVKTDSETAAGNEIDEMNKSADSSRETEDYETLAYESIDFDKLKQSIPDIRGWIYSPGTPISYPVVQGADNQFYLEHRADGTANKNGAIFMDYQNNPDMEDRMTALYGHHIKGNRMFSSIEKYKDQSYYEEHPIVYYYTPEASYEIKLFAGVLTDGANEYLNFKMDDDETESWIRVLQSRSDFKTSFEPNPRSKFMALCTCTYEYTDARYVVYGELNKIADTFPVEAKEALVNPQLTDSDGPYAVLHTNAGDITILLYEEQAPETVRNFISLAKEGYYDGSSFFYVKKGELAQGGLPALEKERSSTGEPVPDEFHDGLHNFPGAVGMVGNGIDQNMSQFYFTVSDVKPEDERIVYASLYVNELLRQSTQELDKLDTERSLTEEEIKSFEDDLNRRIQAINTEGIPTEYAERYKSAVDKYMEYGGSWGLDYKQTVFGQIVKGLNVAEAITNVKVNAANRAPKDEIRIDSVEILE